MQLPGRTARMSPETQMTATDLADDPNDMRLRPSGSAMSRNRSRDMKTSVMTEICEGTTS